jgi:hypothetical protein
MLEDADAEPIDFRPTDRQRGGHAFTETRTGAYYGKLGYLTGLGRSAVNIAESMGDGIHPSYVRTLWRRWGLETAEARCLVPLTTAERCTLAWRAEKRGMTPEEWLRQIAAAAIREGLFDAIVDETPAAAKCPARGGDRQSSTFTASRHP